MAEVNNLHADRQWDARFNVPTDSYLEDILRHIRSEDNTYRYKYVLVSGVEIGTNDTG